MMNKTILTALALTQLSFADEECCPFPSNCKVQVGDPLDPCQINGGYPYPATVSLCDGWNLYAHGDFLYWSTMGGATHSVIQSVSINGEVANLMQKHSYYPGFRVAVGADLGAVVCEISYLSSPGSWTTRYRGGADSFVRSTPPIGPFFLLFPEIKVKMDKRIDIAKISIHKPVYMGKRILMDLNYGLLWLLNDQKYFLTYLSLDGTPNSTYNSKYKLMSIGPDIGFNASALLGWGFQVIVKYNLSIQYTFSTKSSAAMAITQLPVIPFNNSTKVAGKFRFPQSTNLAEMGVAWGGYFSCDRFYVELSATYAILHQHIYDAGFPAGTTGVIMTGDGQSKHGIVVGGQFFF